MNTILDTVREGRTDLLPGLVKPLAPTERRMLLTELTALRREVRAWDWDRWQERDRIRAALLVAGAGCHCDTAGTASWIGADELRDGKPLPVGLLLDVLAARDPHWLGELAHRLADRAATAKADYPLIRELVRLAGCPVPTSDAFVHGWIESIFTVDRARTTHHPLSVALRRDPHARELVPLLFETEEPPEALHWCSDPQAPNHWPSELAGLAEEGIVERRVLVDGSVARLLRGGRQNQLKFFLVMLQRLGLTPAEERERIPDWIAMAADAPSPLAGHAQEVLARLAEAGDLPVQRLGQMSVAVLRRPEKKLVRAQLTLVAKALRSDRTTRHVLLPAVAGVFGHEDTALQERALKLVAAYLCPDDEALRTELGRAAAALSPAYRRTAAELLGSAVCSQAAAGAEAEGAGDSGWRSAYRETLPPVPARRRLATVPPPLAETAGLVAAVGHCPEPALTDWESALDGLVRHAHRDRAALAAALRPALAGRRWYAPDRRVRPDRLLAGVDLVAAAVLGQVRAEDLQPQRHPGGEIPQDCVHAATAAVATARLVEAAHRVLTAPVPFLLATPTWETGSLEPDELLVRLAAYRDLRVEPAPADFAQALLRVRRDPAAAPAAAALGTAEGERLAAWLTTAGEPAGLVRRVREPGPRAHHHWSGRDRFAQGPRLLVLEGGERPVVEREFPAEFHPLGRVHHQGGACCPHGEEQSFPRRGVLPEDRETQAAWLLPALTAGAVAGERGAGALLPGLAQLGGPAGPALHLAVATGLGARDGADRHAAVDALLVLAARGDLDAPRLGGDLAELLSMGVLKATRLAEAMRTAAATGAYATTWAVLAEALPALLAGGAPRGTGELLAVAAECVERSGAEGPAPAGLAGTASRAGSSQLATQARRLRAALTAAA
ncbi:DUF6493 family protein [Streptomyces sp. NPDC006326]|uniref:DUF6493 family protein n=1 Tax=Streptomyces sp. NPDC006326 TaxID=3156752 RepID=UPI0033A826A9